MKTYCTSDMTDAEITTLREKIRKERWVWTCNGMVLPYDEEKFFEFQRAPARGDVIGLLYKDRPTHNVPVMG